jgi:hypothetical protein
MSVYRLLQDHVLPGGAYVLAGTIVSTVDVGGGLPTNWVPSGNCEPLDNAAVTAFYAAGPQFPGLIALSGLGRLSRCRRRSGAALAVECGR